MVRYVQLGRLPSSFSSLNVVRELHATRGRRQLFVLRVLKGVLVYKCAHAVRHVGGSGGMPPRKILKFQAV